MGNADVAVRAAIAVLAALELPAGATRSGVDPEQTGTALTQPGEGPPATPDVVDLHAWWVVPGSPAAALAYVGNHAPAGTFISDRGFSGIRGRVTEEVFGMTWRTVPPGLESRTLVVSVTSAGQGATALRADAEVVWLIPHPPSATIQIGRST